MKSRKQVLRSFLGRLTSTIGFRAIGGLLQYEREAKEATWLLSFSYASDPRGYGAFTYGPGILFEFLAKWLTPLDAGIKGKAPTIATVSHFLRPAKKYAEWTFTNEEDLERLWNPILDDIQKYAIPFLERNSDYPEFRKAVECSAIPREWLGYDEEECIRTMAVFQLLDDNKGGALKILEDALAKRKDSLPKHWREIESLRKRIAQAG